MQLGIWAWIPPLPPFFCNSMISEKNIWVRIYVQFHFLYIFVGRVDRIHKTTNLTMFFFTFSLQTSDVLGTSWTDIQKRPTQIFGLMIIWSKYLDFSNCVFTMNCSTEKKIAFWSFIGQGFIYMWEKFHLSQSSYSCFSQKYPIFWTTNVQILFFCLNICIFTQVKTKKIVFGRKMSKI